MGFASYLIFFIFAFLQFGEMLPDLAQYRIMLWLAAITTFLSLANASDFPFRMVQPWIMLGFMGSIVMSHVANGWFGGGVMSAQDFSLSVFMFYLLLATAHNIARIRILAACMVLCGLLMCIRGAVSYHLGYWDDLVMKQTVDIVGGAGELRRMRALGFLKDPNDLAQYLLVIAPFLLAFWKPGSTVRNLILVIIPSFVIVYGLFLTRSRGAILGIGIMLLFGLRSKIGIVRAVVISGVLLVGILLLGFSGGRGFGTSDSSNFERLDAWGVGLELLKSKPLFGVGYGTFRDHNRLTAHNSYVLCFAELGMVGYFFWLALIFSTFADLQWLKRRMAQLPRPRDETLKRWLQMVETSLVGLLTTSWFLSRTYTITLYVLLGMAVVLVATYDREAPAGAPLVPSPAIITTALRVGLAQGVSIVLVYFMAQFRYL